MSLLSLQTETFKIVHNALFYLTAINQETYRLEGTILKAVLWGIVI